MINSSSSRETRTGLKEIFYSFTVRLSLNFVAKKILKIYRRSITRYNRGLLPFSLLANLLAACHISRGTRWSGRRTGRGKGPRRCIWKVRWYRLNANGSSKAWAGSRRNRWQSRWLVKLSSPRSFFSRCLGAGASRRSWPRSAKRDKRFSPASLASFLLAPSRNKIFSTLFVPRI